MSTFVVTENDFVSLLILKLVLVLALMLQWFGKS